MNKPQKKTNRSRTSTHKLGFFDKNDDIETPRQLYQSLNDLHHFDFDPCPKDADFDGLCCEWGNRNFVNPPFSQIKKWLKKGIQELEKGKDSLFLLTLRTNSKYWINFVYPYASQITLILDKVCFEGYEKPFPVPLVLIHFDHANPPLNKNQFRSKELCKNIRGFDLF